MTAPPTPSLADRLARLSPEQRARLLDRMGAAAPRPAPIPRHPGDSAPLAPAQQRFWFLHRLDPAGHAYNGAAAVRIEGALDLQQLRRALASVVARHAALRTVVEPDPHDAGAVRQRVLPPHEPALPLHDLACTADPQAQMQALLRQLREQPFEPAQSLGRHALVRLAEHEHVFFCCLHHLVADGWSFGLLLRELQAAYQGQPLPAPALQLGDYAAWDARRAASGERAAQRAWWRAQLAGVPPGLDLARPAVPAGGTGHLALPLPASWARGLRAFGQQVPGATPFVVLLTALVTVLHRLHGAHDLVVANAVARRDRPELQDLLGNVADVQLLRTRCSAAPSFLALAGQVRDSLLDAQAHGDASLAEVVEALEQQAAARGAPAGHRRAPSDVLVSFLHMPQPAWEVAGLRFRLLPLAAGDQDFALSISFHEEADGLRGQLWYRRDRLGEEDAQAIAQGLHAVLERALEQPQQALAALLPGPAVDPQQERALEAQLRALPGVHDAVVRRRGRAAAPTAWLVLDGPAPPERIDALLGRLEPGQRPELCCPVARIPLDAAGAVDVGLLARVPVLEPRLLQELEATQPGSCAVVLEADDAPVVPTSSAAAAMNPSEPAPVAAGTPPAIADGGPLELPPGAPQTLVAALQATAAADHGGIVHAGRSLAEPAQVQSYAELYRAARARLGALRRRGLRAGDRAILSFEAPREHLVAFWACLLGGIVPVTVAVAPSYAQANGVVGKLLNTWRHLGRPPVLTGREQARQMQSLADWMPDADLDLLAVEDLESVTDGVEVHAPQPEDTAFIQLSSGSTGTPKCIAITHRGVLLHVHSWVAAAGFSSADVSLNWLPLDHVVPLLTCHLRDLCLGRLQVIAPTAAVLAEPLYWLDLIERHRVTHTWAPNFAYRLVSARLAAQPQRRWDLSSVRWFVNAGEQVTAPVVAEFIARTQGFGLPPRPVHNEFGMAELCTTMTHGPGFDPRAQAHRYRKSTLGGQLQRADADQPESEVVGFVGAGRPTPGVRLRIADGAGATLPAGVIGRLQVQGGVVTPGYVDNPEANAAAFADAGWFDTGDLGFIADGELTLTGRSKETIVIRGANFYCHEIEDVVNTVPDVEPTWVACVAADDPASGSEGLVVFYVPSAQAAAPRVVRERVTAVLGAALGLQALAVVPLARAAFPRTTSGKIQRAGLAAQWRAGAFAGQWQALADGPGQDLPPAALLAQPAWVPAQPRPGLALAGPWVLLGDNAVARALLAAWTGVLPLQARTPDGLGTLARHKGPLAIVDVTPCALEGPQAQLAHLTRLASVCDSGGVARLLVACRGTGSDAAAVRAALACWAQEAAVPVRCVALPGASTAADGELLRDELASGACEPAVAWHEGRRCVPRLRPLVPAARAAAPWRSGMRVLVTGGLGGIGQELAQHLLLAWRAELLLVGRSAEAEHAPVLDRLRALPGSVRHVACDAADASALAAALARAEAEWGAPVDVVVHLAGSQRVGPLRQADPVLLDAILAPKLAGTRAALGLLEARPQAFALLFGSVLAHLPRAGAAVYAAANAVLEAEAEAWMRVHGPRCRVLAFSGWSGIGLSAEDVDAALLHATTGQVAVTPGAAWRWLDTALASDATRLVAGIDPRHWNVRRLLEGSPLRRQALALVAPAPLRTPACVDRFGLPVPVRLARVAALPRTATGAPDRATLSALPELGGAGRRRAPATGMEQRLALLWTALLGRPAVDAGDNFFALGGHSLLAMQLMARIREQIGVELPARAVFEAPTLEALALRLEQEAGADEAFEEGVL